MEITALILIFFAILTIVVAIGVGNLMLIRNFESEFKDIWEKLNEIGSIRGKKGEDFGGT